MGAVEKIAHAALWRCSERYVTAARMYRIFKRAEGAASVRSVVIAMVIAACLMTAIGVVRDGAGRAGMSQRVIAGVALQVALYLGAQRLVDPAGLRQRILHQGHGERPFEDGLVRKNEHPLDL